jgi:hypothetical protein
LPDRAGAVAARRSRRQIRRRRRRRGRGGPWRCELRATDYGKRRRLHEAPARAYASAVVTTPIRVPDRRARRCASARYPTAASGTSRLRNLHRDDCVVQRLAFGNIRAHGRDERLQVAALRRERRSDIVPGLPWPGTTAFAGIFPSSSIAASQPFALASSAGCVSRNSRSPVHKMPLCLVEHGQVAISVRRRPRAQAQLAIAEVEFDDILTSRSGAMICSADAGASKSPANSRRKKSRLRASAAPSRAMTDVLRLVGPERRVAEHMVDVHMRVDDIADRQRRVLVDRRAQLAPDAARTAGVDDRDATRADDESDVGDVIVAGRVERELFAGMHETPVANLIDGERQSARTGRPVINSIARANSFERATRKEPPPWRAWFGRNLNTIPTQSSGWP